MTRPFQDALRQKFPFSCQSLIRQLIRRDMYTDGFIKYMKVTFHDSHWFVRSSVKASMIKSVKYVVDVMIGQDRSFVESQCECGAGMGTL